MKSAVTSPAGVWKMSDAVAAASNFSSQPALKYTVEARARTVSGVISTPLTCSLRSPPVCLLSQFCSRALYSADPILPEKDEA